MSLHVLQSLCSMVSPIEGRGRGGQVLCDYPFHEINELACSAVLTLNGEPKGGERGGLAPLSTGSSYYSMRRPKTLQQLLHHWGHCSARAPLPALSPGLPPLSFPLGGHKGTACPHFPLFCHTIHRCPGPAAAAGRQGPCRDGAAPGHTQEASCARGGRPRCRRRHAPRGARDDPGDGGLQVSGWACGSGVDGSRSMRSVP